MAATARVPSVLSRRNALWSIVWVVVSLPLTFVLAAPTTTPAAEYARASARAQQLGMMLNVPASAMAEGGARVPPSSSNDDRYSRYLLSRAFEREENAKTHPWPQRLAMFKLLLLTMCIMPAWLVISTLTQRRRA